MLAAILLNSDAVLSCVRREVRRVTDMLVDKESIETVLREQVIKRETLEGEPAQNATRRFNRKSERSLHQVSCDTTGESANAADLLDSAPAIVSDKSPKPEGDTVSR